jgi:hypothetical protein
MQITAFLKIKKYYLKNLFDQKFQNNISNFCRYFKRCKITLYRIDYPISRPIELINKEVLTTPSCSTKRPFTAS